MKRPIITKFPRIPTKQDFLGVSIGIVFLSASLIIYTNYSTAQSAGNQSGFGNLNISLSKAIDIAQQSANNNSYAIAAFGEKIDGGIVYSIMLATDGLDFYEITVDPGNGIILSTENISKDELEKRHLEHSQRVLTEPHLMNNTFVH